MHLQGEEEEEERRGGKRTHRLALALFLPVPLDILLALLLPLAPLCVQPPLLLELGRDARLRRCGSCGGCSCCGCGGGRRAGGGRVLLGLLHGDQRTPRPRRRRCTLTRGRRSRSGRARDARALGRAGRGRSSLERTADPHAGRVLLLRRRRTGCGQRCGRRDARCASGAAAERAALARLPGAELRGEEGRGGRCG